MNIYGLSSNVNYINIVKSIFREGEGEQNKFLFNTNRRTNVPEFISDFFLNDTLNGYPSIAYINNASTKCLLSYYGRIICREILTSHILNMSPMLCVFSPSEKNYYFLIEEVFRPQSYNGECIDIPERARLLSEFGISPDRIKVHDNTYLFQFSWHYDGVFVTPSIVMGLNKVITWYKLFTKTQKTITDMEILNYLVKYSQDDPIDVTIFCPEFILGVLLMKLSFPFYTLDVLPKSKSHIGPVSLFSGQHNMIRNSIHYWTGREKLEYLLNDLFTKNRTSEFERNMRKYL